MTPGDLGSIDETRSFKVLAPGTVVSHYKIIEKIGEGGMGVVYKATDTKLDRTVALKFLPPRLLCDSEARERFEHEAKAASALNHPNIATIYEIDEVEGRCFIAMEYLEGGSLKEHMGKRDLSIKEILDLAIQVGEGLNAAHERGVVHRDIKPDNVMLTSKGLPKIMDFGLAKLKGATKVTKTGTTLGTLQYMSPEQASGREVDHRSDIFSFGVILYEMLAGRQPFRGETEAAIINSILNDTPEPLARYKADVPAGLQRIVDRALEKDSCMRHQHADDMVAELRHEKQLLETGASRVTQTLAGPRSPRRRYLPVVIPAVIAAAVILIILIFEPFRIEMGPGDEASAQQNSLAVMYFENLADREDKSGFAQMITALLITDLSESHYLRVVSRQRLYDILSLLGKEDLKTIDKTVASDVAKRAGVKWILIGSILRTEPNIVLTSDISEALTGEVLATQRISGEAGEDLFAVVDKLTAQIKDDLALPDAAQEEVDRPVAEVTTHSPEAYRHYLKGLDYSRRMDFVKAEEELRTALTFDSTLAMAYLELSNIEWMKGGTMQVDLVAQAVKYSGNTSERERYAILARDAELSGDYVSAIEQLEKIVERFPDDKDALHSLGGFWRDYIPGIAKSVECFSKVIEIDPSYGPAYNGLAYAYSDIGDFERAIWAANRQVDLAPAEPNPYDTQGDVYATFGKLDQAIESYRKALEISPEFSYSLGKLGHMYLIKRDYAVAESYYRKLVSSKDKNFRSMGRYCLALSPAFQGKFDTALEVLDDGLGADQMEQTPGVWTALKHFLAASLLGGQGESAEALSECRKGLDIWVGTVPEARFDWMGYYCMLLVETSEIKTAEGIARELKSDTRIFEQARMLHYGQAMGRIELAKGNAREAIAYLEQASEIAPVNMMHLWIPLASAHLEAGRLGEAVDLLEEWVLQYPQAKTNHPIQAVKIHYLLGLAYERSGWTNKAIEQYEEFLDIWTDADPGIAEVENARERLARLKGSS